MEMPRQKHQTQPLYTAPRLSDRYDRVSPLNSRRSNADNYHDNKLMQNQRQNSKSMRRHSTNTYSSSNQKELSPTNSIQQQSQMQQQMNNNSSR